MEQTGARGKPQKTFGVDSDLLLEKLQRRVYELENEVKRLRKTLSKSESAKGQGKTEILSTQTGLSASDFCASFGKQYSDGDDTCTIHTGQLMLAKGINKIYGLLFEEQWYNLVGLPLDEQTKLTNETSSVTLTRSQNSSGEDYFTIRYHSAKQEYSAKKLFLKAGMYIHLETGVEAHCYALPFPLPTFASF